MEREMKFGKILAIANVLGERVKDKGEIGILPKYMERYGFKPATTFEHIHKDLMQYSHKFGESETSLFDQLTEAVASINEEEFTDKPLRGRYLQAYGAKQHELNQAMGR
ncbi:type I-C CRISPR-associated protein Cas8c/Csd1 (plasmid) [Paenibacillus polymyxa]|nr:type I-C CRISPR-associated protein Cas8c/Csd1 [Paenibacillus polymyxa]WPQ59488.1 type I-C CRISPR-associated protein Cas8c/Csd1 [Paenibacillus polymyxa]